MIHEQTSITIMDARTWLLPITFAVIIAIPIFAVVGYMIRESFVMRKNRGLWCVWRSILF